MISYFTLVFSNLFIKILQKFYIIGHNPNTIGEAVDYLKNGANGIEPDICYVENTNEKFYVYEKLPLIPEEIQDLTRSIIRGEVPSLKNYLLALKDVLRTNARLKLYFIAFDLKPPYSYDINELYEVIRNNFSADFPKTAILTTVSHPAAMSFLSGIKIQRINEAVGVDENTTPAAVKEFFKMKELNYDFGTGISMPGLSSAADTFTDRARMAVSMKSLQPGKGLKFVHAWTVNSETSMKTYLDIGVDAIITDKPGRLKSLVESPAYAGKYVLADETHNPFI
jgi:hypothetical protein